MTIQLDLEPEKEDQLIAQAAARGVSVEELLIGMIDTLLTASDTLSSIAPSPQERSERFIRWTKRCAVKTPPLSDEAISRENIYGDRENRQR